MILQNVVWTIALVGMGLIAAGFVWVIIQAGKPADDAATRKSTHTAHVLQAWLFIVLLVGFVFGSWATLRQFPIPPQHGVLKAAQVVNVTSRQWAWQFAPDTVQTGSTVEFRVTSADVNHGFAIYSPEGHIVTQVQAMPGYTNKLLHTFTEAGAYTVQCLEYCGLMHAQMTRTLHVVAPGAAAGAAPAGHAATVAVATPAATLSGPALGEQVYRTNCAVCHQATGKGLPGIFPPLTGNAVVIANDPSEHIRIVLDGTQGRSIDGVTYAAQMPGWGSELNDEQIAAAINHERTSWGNHAPTITAKDVAALRKP